MTISINEISNILGKSDKWVLPKDTTFILADSEKNNFIVCKKNLLSFSASSNIFTFSGSTNYFGIKRDRGKILEGFCRLEMIIDELFVIILGGFIKTENQKIIRNMLERLSLADKISILREEKVISDKQKKLLWNLKDFRNQIAHEFVLRELFYKTRQVIDDKRTDYDKNKFISFKEIGDDFNDAWNGILKLYTKEQKSVINWIEKIFKANNLLKI
jgi:hypothetical protein